MDRFGRPWIPFFKFGPNRRFLDLYFPLKNWTNSADFLKNSFLIGRFYFFSRKTATWKKIGEKIIFFQNLSSFQGEKNFKIFSREIEKRFRKKNLFLFSSKKILKKESFSFLAKKEFEKIFFFQNLFSSSGEKNISPTPDSQH